MTEDRDLLPWILGALSMAAIAMAVAIGLSGKSAPVHAYSPNSAAPTLATAEPSLNAPVSARAAAQSSLAQSSLAPPPALAASASAQSGDQIWECTIDGVKTFSNKRCGSAAVLRDVGPINVMDASPVASNVHWYGPDTNDTPDYYYPAPQPVDNAYSVVGVPYLERRRPEHPHQPTHYAGAHAGAIGAR
jgi:hypothetical protein